MTGQMLSVAIILLYYVCTNSFYTANKSNTVYAVQNLNVYFFNNAN